MPSCSFWSRFFVYFDSKMTVKTFRKKNSFHVACVILRWYMFKWAKELCILFFWCQKVCGKLYIISITTKYFGLSYFSILVYTLFLVLKCMRKNYGLFPLLQKSFGLPIYFFSECNSSSNSSSDRPTVLPHLHLSFGI